VKQSPSWLEIDLGAIRRNVIALRKFVGPNCGILGVVKNNAYGHGAKQVTQAAADGGGAGVCVASLEEAQELRRAGISLPILLLNPGEPKSAREVLRLHAIQTLCTKEMAEALSQAALKIGFEAEAHVKVDTGMTRLGIPPEKAVAFTTEVAGYAGLHITGIFSHLATSENCDSPFAQEQFERFCRVLGELAPRLPKLKAHIANSGATLLYPQMHLDYVRVGLLMYGISPTPRLPINGPNLRPALSWKTRVAFLQSVAPGTAVSYGCTWRANKPSTLAVLLVGYGDGFPRSLSNKGQVLFRGKLKPVVGTVCMNHIMVDVSDEENVQVGEEVVLIGRQGEATLTASHLADWGATVPHEILARLSPRLTRVYK